MESGFSRKSKAPSLVAFTAASMLPWPEITTTTGRSAKGISWMRASTSMPSMPGSQISSSTSSNSPAGQRLQAGFAALHGLHRVAFVFQHAAQRLADSRLVVHYQDAPLLHALAAAGRGALSASASASSSAGISTVKRAPAGWLSSTRMCALCSATMWLTIASPRPVPRFLVEK